MCLQHDPILCIIPPYMLEKMVEKGSKKVREAALKTIKQSNHLRMRRELVQEQPRPAIESLASGVEHHSLQMVRRVYDGKHTEMLPGTLVRAEGDPATGDPAVDEAYDGSGYAWDLFWECYKRNSVDGQGKILDSTVHHSQNYNNAFWDGTQMVYGDGDGQLFTRFTIDLDVIIHELTHAVTQFSAQLRYWFQSGALNESFSDVFGSIGKQRVLKQEAKDADWLIGKEVLIGEKYALRSMKAPGTAYRNHPTIGDDPQPATMDDYVEKQPWDDQGGVHTNSGIPNHAFYLAAIDIGGYAWEKAGRTWFRTLSKELIGKVDCTFVEAAEATLVAAYGLFGPGSLEEKAVEKAWKAVKVI
jgi:Zn-dependent metalloprotease